MSRGPLVYASRQALADAKRFLAGDVVLEERVAAAICRGSLHYGKTIRVVLEGGVLAVCRRVPGRLRPRPRVWLVTDLTKE